MTFRSCNAEFNCKYTNWKDNEYYLSLEFLNAPHFNAVGDCFQSHPNLTTLSVIRRNDTNFLVG